MRALGPLMPGLSAVYGLKEADIVNMRYSLLRQYVDQLDHWASVISSGAYEKKKGK